MSSSVAFQRKRWVVGVLKIYSLRLWQAWFQACHDTTGPL